MMKNPFKIVEKPDDISSVLFGMILLKRFFDLGYNTLSFARWLLAGVGLATQSVSAALWFGFFFLVACEITGYFMYAYGYVEADTEVGNLFNRFVAEMRNRNNA